MNRDKHEERQQLNHAE